jgi:prepilin signal peptidase PulO-like enzyme (type II secretory pathway)
VITSVVDAGVAVAVIAVLVLLAAIDIRRRIVPNRIVLPVAAVVLAVRTVTHPSPVWLLAGLAAAGFLLAVTLATRGGLGMGDVKLALLLGFATGRAVPLALAAGFVAAFLPSLVLLVRHGRGSRAIPFAPFLGFGGALVLLLTVS